MPKSVWFLAGFLFALALGGLLVVLPTVGSGAGNAPVAAPAEIPAPAEAQPAPSVASAGLHWVRQGGGHPLLGACSRLEIDAAWQIHYGPCDQGTRLAYLSEGELAWYQAYILTLAPFDYRAGAITLAFAGQGSRPASAQEQAALAAWAEGVYTRVMGEEQRANLLAQARLDLMARRGVGIEAIQVLAIEPVRWPDACLGLRQPGVACTRVSTPGYRIILATGGETIEYRADAYGLVRAVAGHPAHLVVPPLAP